MMSTTTIRVSFMRGRVHLGLMARNDLFREAVAKFEPGSAVVLVREGYGDVPLAIASNDDVMFADAAIITGTLKPTSKVIVPANPGK